jgi:hypothetical protein
MLTAALADCAEKCLGVEEELRAIDEATEECGAPVI